MNVTRFRDLIQLLTAADVEYIVVGGAAARALGSSRITQDPDIVYRRSPDNLARVASALTSIAPYPRGAPPGLPFKWDRRTLELGCNFTLETTVGLIDLLGEIAGGGGYDELLPHTVRLDVFGVSCQCLDLDTLIRTKKAAGRPKDFEHIAELEAIRDGRDRDG